MNWFREAVWPSMPDSKPLDPDTRAAIERSRQYAASADVLWYAGHRVSALHHAERGLHFAISLHAATDEDRTEASSEGRPVRAWFERQAALLSDEDRERIVAAVGKLDFESVPIVDRDVPTRAGRYLRALLRAQQRALQPHTHKLHTRFGVWLRRMRFVLVVALLACAGTYLAMRPSAPAVARASATFSSTYPASAVLDGEHTKRTNEWILPHRRKMGWIEVDLGAPTELKQVRIKNASHPPHHTYGTKTFRLEVFSGKSVVYKEEGAFGKPDVKSPWFVSKAINKRGDRIRIHVLTHYGPAGGLAEIDWD